MKYTRRTKLLHYDYTLTERYDLWLPLDGDLVAPPRNFQNQWGGFQTEYKDGKLCLHLWANAGYSWDGATGVRDVKGILEASLFHDFLYQFMRAICIEMRWIVPEGVDWSNKVFYRIAKNFRCKRALLYYTGVEWLGGIFWRIAHWKEW